MARKRPTKKPTTKTADIDPRIANVLARFDEWRDNEADVETKTEVGRFVAHLVQQFDWSKPPPAIVRKVVATLLESVDSEELDHLNEIANTEREIFLQCTAGQEATEALAKCGLTPVEAESIAHKAIADSLAKQVELANAEVRVARERLAALGMAVAP